MIKVKDWYSGNSGGLPLLLVQVMVAIDKAGQSVDLSVDDGIWRLHNSAAALACTKSALNRGVPSSDPVWIYGLVQV